MITTTHQTPSIIRTLLKDVSWYTLGQVIAQVCSLFGVIIVSRYLGPSAMGVYSFVQNYVAIFVSALLGLNLYFTWNMVTGSDRETIIREQFWYKLYLSVFLGIVGSLIAYIVLPHDIAFLIMLMFAPILLYATSAVFHHSVSSRDSKKVAYAYGVAAILLLIAKYLAVLYHAGLPVFVIISGVDVVLAFILLFIAYSATKRTGFFHTIPSINALFSFLVRHRYGIIVVVVWQFLIKVDQLTLALFSTPHTLGIYAATTKIAEVPHFLIGVLYTVCAPYVAELFDDKEGGHLRTIFVTHVLLGVLLAVFVIICAPYIVSVLYGSQFMETIPVLRVYALAFPGMFLTLYYFSLYGARERHKFQAYTFLFSALLNALFVAILTPHIGLVGAALATSATYTISALVLYGYR
jgi:O-antigen/teichoic acid export membrane protein